MIFKIFGKSSEIFGKFSGVIGIVRNGSQELIEEFRSWLLRCAQMDPSKLLRASNDGKVEWNTARCILPVAYRRICNGNPGL